MISISNEAVEAFIFGINFIKVWIFTLKHPNQSAVAEPTLKTGHRIDMDEVQTLHMEDNYWKRKIKEKIEIKKHPNNLNRDDGYNLYEMWNLIL